MNNLMAIFAVVVITLLVLKVVLGRRKRGLPGLMGKVKLLIILMLTGCLWCPLTLLYCVKNPKGALIYGSKMGIVALRVKGDVNRTVKRVDNKVNQVLAPYTPKVGKVVVKEVTKGYDRYGVRDTQRFVAQTGEQVGVRLVKPKPSIWEKVSNGVVELFRWCLVPVTGKVN